MFDSSFFLREFTSVILEFNCSFNLLISLSLVNWSVVISSLVVLSLVTSFASVIKFLSLVGRSFDIFERSVDLLLIIAFIESINFAELSVCINYIKFFG
jgi:hypothetical protein